MRCETAALSRSGWFAINEPSSRWVLSLVTHWTHGFTGLAPAGRLAVRNGNGRAAVDESSIMLGQSPRLLERCTSHDEC